MPALNSPRAELACQALASGKDQKAAYIAGGYVYAPASAHKFFRRPENAARVKELLEQRYAAEGKAREIGIEKAGLTEAWIIERLKYLTERSLRGKPILDKDGKQTGHFSGNPDGATAARCLELAAKIKGLLVHKVEVGDPGDFARLDDEKLDSEIDRMAAALGYVAPKGSKRPATEH